jgi:hypothetical protein
MGHHIVYLGPWSSIAKNVLESITECIKHNEHNTSVLVQSDPQVTQPMGSLRRFVAHFTDP